MPILLSAKNISKKFGNFKALDDVSIEVPVGCIFGLLGPNGAGKTTLIRIINQITGPDSGNILFEERLLEPHHVSEIGYLPEERGLYRKMGVGEQAVYLARLKGLSKKDANARVKEWFARFGMDGWWKKKVEELSKGMQQKVQFIVTVLHEPRLLILDEPFSGFDPINAQLIRNEILRLRDNGATIILSTHNMGSVEELCDNIALINKGKKILDGTVKEIRAAYAARTYDILFKGNMIGFTNALWTGAEIIEKHEDENKINHVRLKLLGNSTPNQILELAIRSGEVHAFNEVLPTMNDIFIMKVQEHPDSYREEKNILENVIGTKSNFTE